MDLLTFIVFIVIIAAVWFTCKTFIKKEVADQKPKVLTTQERIDAVRATIKVPGTKLNSSLKTMVGIYQKSDVVIDNHYQNWETKSDKLKDMCTHGSKLLEYHLMKSEPVALKIADAIATKLVEKLSKIDGEVIEQNPWTDGWYQPSITMTHFLAQYVYVGENETLIEGCKVQLLRLLPEVGLCFKKNHSGFNLVKVSVPRLCVTYLTPEKFSLDITADKFSKIREYMNLTHVQDDNVQDGYYDDGSVVLDGLASYARFVEAYGFYEDLYRGMGLPTNIKDQAVKIFPKLTHPDIPYYPLGLFRSNGDRKADSLWPWTYTNTGITLIPFIGLGVFKCPEFMFFIRVQRPGIYANYAESPDLAIGCVQIRRIFLKKKSYPTSLSKKNLKDEPGVLCKADGSVSTLAKEKSYECRDVKSFIGTLDGLMFWKNSYKFPELFDKVTITEAGVITTAGLQAHYQIENSSDETFKFRYKDSMMKYNETNPKGYDGFVNVNKETKNFTWTMATKMVDFKVKLTKNGMTFETSPDKKYVVQEIDGPNDQYVVTCGPRSLLGSSSSKISNIIYKATTYKRNPDTMMYEK